MVEDYSMEMTGGSVLFVLEAYVGSMEAVLTLKWWRLREVVVWRERDCCLGLYMKVKEGE